MILNHDLLKIMEHTAVGKALAGTFCIKLNVLFPRCNVEFREHFTVSHQNDRGTILEKVFPKVDDFLVTATSTQGGTIL